MMYTKSPLARGASLLCAASVLATSVASAQPNRGLAPSVDTGAIASAKGDMSSPQDVTLSKVRWDQKQGNTLPLGAAFKDESGQEVKLGKYFKGDKPVVLMLIFFNCTMLCSEVMNGSLDLFRDRQKELGFELGRDYEAVTISIDPTEGSELAAAKKKTYISQLPEQKDAAKGWHLLTGKDDQIKAVADAIGYRYTYDAATEQYAHPGGIVTITPEGKVSRYFPGVSFIGKDVRLGLIEASRNKIGTPMEKLALFTCFHYNPTTGQYSLALMNIVKLAALATILGIGTGIWTMRRYERKVERKRAENAKIGGDKPAALGT